MRCHRVANRDRHHQQFENIYTNSTTDENVSSVFFSLSLLIKFTTDDNNNNTNTTTLIKIVEVHPKKNSVGVRWVKEIGDNLYAWDGTSHVIHVETLLEINLNMFRRSSRPAGKGEVRNGQRAGRTGGKKKKKVSQAKGSREVFERVAFIHPAPKSRAKRGRHLDDDDDDDDDGVRRVNKIVEEEVKKEKKKPPTTMNEITNEDNKKNVAQAKKPPPPTKSYTTAAEMKKKIKNNNNKEEREPIEWSENVTGETFCNQVQVPFNYITNRFMLSSDDKIIEEERYFEKCTCKRLASIFTSNRDDPVTDADVHEYNKGECPTKSIDCGSVLFKLHVYKRDNDRIGFGIRATRDISTGSFICEYVGEIISREQAQFREKEYSKQGWYYLHDITSPVNEKKYSIDPTRSGNVGRFFNHSCKPNCTTLELPNNAQKHKKHASPSDAPTEKERIIETMKYVPRLAFFACKDVKKGEQLTIDYSPNRFGNKLKKTVKCMCSERLCKRWLF